MLVAAIAALVIGMCVSGWTWSRVARKAGTRRLSWAGTYPPGTGWRLRTALGLGAGLTIWGGWTTVQQTQLPLALAVLPILGMLLPWIAVTVRHNRAVGV